MNQRERCLMMALLCFILSNTSKSDAGCLVCFIGGMLYVASALLHTLSEGRNK